MADRQECAVTFTARERAELLPFEPDATPLGPDDVAGRTLASLVSPGTEINHGYLGERFPTGSGYAAAFEVEALGEAVTDLAVGDRVFAVGNHRSYQRATRQTVLLLPTGLAPEVAVFARLMGVSMTTLVTTHARPSSSVIVSGLGPVGHLAAQIFAACGYTVMGVDPVESRRRAAAGKGIDPVWERIPTDDPSVRDRIALVVECSGHEQAALDACNVVRKGGEVVLIGTPWHRRTDRLAHELLHAVFHRYVHLRSGWEWELPHQPTEFVPGSVFGNLAAALDWLASGRVRVEGLFSHAHPQDAQHVYQDLLHRRTDTIVTVFDWTQVE